ATGMLLMRRKGQTAPFTLITLILLFGRKKTEQEENKNTAEPLNREPFPVPDIIKKTITSNDVSRSRDRLRLASLERDIIGDALTKIYEAETKGQINDSEKNQLLQRYKTDLKRVDGEIDTHKRTVDLYELESAKDELLKSFQEKMLEIDLKISQIRPTVTATSETITKSPEPPKTETSPTPLVTNPPKERQTKEKPKNKAEERLETIREEVLNTMANPRPRQGRRSRAASREDCRFNSKEAHHRSRREETRKNLGRTTANTGRDSSIRLRIDRREDQKDLREDSSERGRR